MLPALALAGAVAVALVAPPAPSRWMTDATGTLGRAEVAALDAKLEAFERQTGHQLVVYVGRSTQGEPIEEWAARAFEAWRIGRVKLDDGAALFVMLDDRAARIEVGYGLEPRLTDAQASRILRDVLAPAMARGDLAGALTGSVDAMSSAIGGGGGAPPGRVALEVPWFVYAVAGVLFLALLIWKPRLALFFLMMLSGRRRGSGPGGFQGGGGRSGGAGATGRW